MTQYLSKIKRKCDAIDFFGSPLTPEDIILFTSIRLPTYYQAFKTPIGSNLQPISFDDFYALLCCEEVNIANDTTQEAHSNILSSVIC